MIEPTTMSDTERLARIIERIAGVVVPEGQYPHLEQAARVRATAAGFRDLASYVDHLVETGMSGDLRRLLSDVTIKESFLFRVPQQFQALHDEILPRLARVRPEAHRLRVWSAGCARGEEAATLAIVMAECPFLAHRDWEIVATDVDEAALDDARRGEYGARAVAQVPPHMLRSWFEKRGDGYALSGELSEHIDYCYFNFFQSPYLSLGPSFDVIFLRNVLIYFNPDKQRDVFEKVIRRLAGDDYLFLGHSESVWQWSGDMEPLEFDDCFAYRRRQPGDRAQAPMRKKPASTVALPARPPSAPPSAAPQPSVSPAVPEPEDFEAPPEAAIAAAARALTEDRLEDSREIVERCLKRRIQSAEAHSLSGLLHDLQGHCEAAVAAYRAALFIEPHLFQVRFLLAHRFEHMGWPLRARNEYRQVLTDLSHGEGRELPAPLGGSGGLLRSLLPRPEEAARRCRRALGRSGPARPAP